MLGTSTLSALCLVAVMTTRAEAEPRIVVIEGPGLALPSLGTRITLHGGGTVAVTTVRESGLTDLAARAPAILAAHRATLVVWVEPVRPTDRVAVVYVAGRFPDRALFELVRIEVDTPPPEIERLISLKLVGLLDAVLAPGTDAALGVRPNRRADRWRLAVGLDTAFGAADRAIAAGPTVTVAYRGQPLAIYVEARMLLAEPVKAPEVTTSIAEYAAAAGIEYARGSLFATAGLATTLFRANAASSDGRRGSATELVPILRAGVGVRIPVSSAEVAISAMFEHSAIRQRFLVDGASVADLGRERVVLGVVVSLPLR